MKALGAIVAVATALLVLPTGAPASGSPLPDAPERILLAPDLTPFAPEEIVGPETRFMTTLGVDAPLMIEGCFTDERIRKGAQRCLRFDGIVANTGAGPLELAYGPNTSEGSMMARQRLFYSDGSFEDRDATRTEYHPTHLHFHIDDFYIAELWKVSKRGRLKGLEPVTASDKNGFCPEDSESIEEQELEPRHYSCFTEDERGWGPHQVVGISAGWKDIYGWMLPDQFVEISGVPDGLYGLKLQLDPNDVFVEADEDNNTVCVVLSLQGAKAVLTDPLLTC